MTYKISYFKINHEINKIFVYTNIIYSSPILKNIGNFKRKKKKKQKLSSFANKNKINIIFIRLRKWMVFLWANNGLTSFYSASLEIVFQTRNSVSLFIFFAKGIISYSYAIFTYSQWYFFVFHMFSPSFFFFRFNFRDFYRKTR